MQLNIRIDKVLMEIATKTPTTLHSLFSMFLSEMQRAAMRSLRLDIIIAYV